MYCSNPEQSFFSSNLFTFVREYDRIDLSMDLPLVCLLMLI